MSFEPISTSRHCSAPLLGLLTAGTFFGFWWGEARGPRGSQIFILPSAREAVLLALSIGPAFALRLEGR
jgi:hypothetical protein